MTSENALYSDLAEYYDRFCADIDYQQHIAFSQRLHDCFGSSKGKDYLDLACGTGQLLQPMVDAGYTATGLDYSGNMLASAQKRCPSAQLIESDMAHLSEKRAFDLITCFLYSIHYSHPVSAIKTTLERVFKALKPGGVFVFDTVDKFGIQEKDVISTTPSEDGTLLTFRSGWRYPGEGETLTLHIAIMSQNDSGERLWKDRHTMTATSIADLVALMTSTGFDVTPLEHDFSTLREWQGNTYNALLVGAKPL